MEVVINANNLWDVRIHVYVIGYPSQGESILIIFSEDRQIVQTIITDCYTENSCNCIADILNSYNNPKIDWFVWTHPHEDHSKGIPDILETFDKKHDCHIVIPENLHGVPSEKLCTEARNALNYLKDNYCQKGNIGHRRHRNYHTVHFDPDFAAPLKLGFLISDSVTTATMPVTLSILGPDNVASLQNSDGTLQLKPNSFSIVYTLDANGLIMFMAADVNHQGAKIIPDEIFHNFHLLKIPHHGSKEPKSFYSRIFLNEIDDSIGLTTVYPQDGLPQKEAMEIYQKHLGTVYTTHASDKGADFGYVHVQYSPMEIRLTEDPEIQGNAGVY